MKLISKTIISGTITLETGLHIGGSKSSLEIGGIDSPVIKTAKGVPYIPGSSLKGKLRSLLAKEEGATDFKFESTMLKQIFGYAHKENPQVTRLYVRDAYMDETKFKVTFEKAELDTEYTEEKVENTIDRISGTSKGGLRHIERVPAGAVFNFEMVLNKFENDPDFLPEIRKAINLFKDDYLGGSGSRGYGKVKGEITETKVKLIESYRE
jgi:CRISPR-associated protein Csm3